MIQPLQLAWRSFEMAATHSVTEKSSGFHDLFGSAQRCASMPASTLLRAADTPPANPAGDPDVQSWLDSFYRQQSALNLPGDKSLGLSADTPWQAADGAPDIYTPDTMYGPDQIYQQALANQVGNAFATRSGMDAKDLTAQLPGLPSEKAQKAFDSWLAMQNAQRLESGQPIDTSAYWSDPGPVTLHGVTYTSDQLGYCGAAQSSGAEPIYISQNNQVGKDTFTVPGYSGTVKGIEPGRYYTLQQLEQAGLKPGQADAQFHPGSWSQTQSV